MIFSLTTRWNAGRHTDGQAMIEEILALGFQRIELGYDLRIDLVPGVTKMVASGAVRVDSVHNFCPVPVGAPRGHPELFTLASSDRREREAAVHHTLKTVRFAAEVGARVVIVHAGNVEMKRQSTRLCEMYEQGRRFTESYEKARVRLQVSRDRKARKQVAFLRESLEQLLPRAAETGVKVALENLPAWEAIPSELEMEELCRDFSAQGLRYWHDIGHAQIRENLGFINQERWVERLSPYLAGLHVHDVVPPAGDHRLPPEGRVDFARLRRFAEADILRVIEPAPDAPAEKIVEALRFLRQTWGEADG